MYAVALFVLVVSVGTGAASSCPRIITRAQWGAKNPTHTNRFTDKPHVVIIKDAGKNCNSQATCTKAVQNLQYQDMNVDKYEDILCNFVIGSDGKVYQGSGWDNYIIGDRTLALCILGDNFETKHVPQAQKDTIKSFLNCPNTRSKMRTKFVIQSYRDAIPTSINPGRFLYIFMKSLPQWKGLNKNGN